MPILNNATNAKHGTTQVERIYSGTDLVWQYPIPVVVTLTASATQIDSGTGTILTATVTPARSSPVPLTGTVKFRSGSKTGTVVGTDTAPPWAVTVTPLVDTTFYAEYMGSHPYLANTSSTGLPVSVAGEITVNLTADKTSVAQGSSVTLSVTVPGLTSGTVNFRTGSTTGPIVHTATGNSPWTYTATPTADVTYYAEFVGTTEYRTTFSNALPIEFYLPTTCTLTVSKTAVNYGEAITLSAAVPGATSGTVNFRTGSATGPIVATDTTAPWSVSITPTADVTYFATYEGSGDYAKAESAGVAISYSIPTTTTLVTDKASVNQGTAIILTATVTGATAGTVNFIRDSDKAVIGTDTAPPWTFTYTPTKDDAYLATYVANGDYLTSSSTKVAVGFSIPTTITLAGATTINNGGSATLTATIVPTVTGTVRFRSGSTTGTIVASDTASPWTASVSPTTTTTYYATYDGSGDWSTDASAGAKITVRQLVTKTWSSDAVWAQCYNGSNAPKSGDYYYGYYSSTNGNQRSLFGFQIPDLRGAVSITQVRMKFYNQHHFNNSGGTIPTSLHTHWDEPGTYSGSHYNVENIPNAPKPGWVDHYFGQTVRDRVGDTLIRGIGLGPGPDNSQSYYGYANGTPWIEIKYTVWE